MIEPLFGAGSTLWTGVPAAAFAFQPPMAVGSPAGMPSAYGGSMPTIVPQSLPGPNLATAFPYAPNLATVLFGPSQDALAGLTAPALLAAVATRRGQPQG